MSGPTNMQDMIEWGADAKGWATLERGSRAVVHVQSPDGAVVEIWGSLFDGEEGAYKLASITGAMPLVALPVVPRRITRVVQSGTATVRVWLPRG